MAHYLKSLFTGSSSVDAGTINVPRNDRNLIGSGTFGMIYRTKHPGTGEDLAMKIIDTHRIREYAESVYGNVHQNEIIPFLKTELRENPHIIKIYDCKYIGHEMRILMELCQKNLQEYCHQTEMDMPTTCDILWQCSNGIEFLHKKRIVHRDIKPNNFLLAINNSSITIKVTDFSYAKDLNKDRNEQQGSSMHTVRGNPHWLAPELVNEHEKLIDECRFKKSIDVWSLGMVMLYVCVNSDGKTQCRNRCLGCDIKTNMNIIDEIFEGRWRFDLKEKLLPLIRNMMSKDPEERPTMETVEAIMLQKK